MKRKRNKVKIFQLIVEGDTVNMNNTIRGERKLNRIMKLLVKFKGNKIAIKHLRDER